MAQQMKFVELTNDQFARYLRMRELVKKMKQVFAANEPFDNMTFSTTDLLVDLFEENIESIKKTQSLDELLTKVDSLFNVTKEQIENICKNAY